MGGQSRTSPYTLRYEEVTAYADLGAEITQTAEK